jgi:hypothetical protein
MGTVHSWIDITVLKMIYGDTYRLNRSVTSRPRKKRKGRLDDPAIAS